MGLGERLGQISAVLKEHHAEMVRYRETATRATVTRHAEVYAEAVAAGVDRWEAINKASQVSGVPRWVAYSLRPDDFWIERALWTNVRDIARRKAEARSADPKYVQAFCVAYAYAFTRYARRHAHRSYALGGPWIGIDAPAPQAPARTP